MTNAVSVSWKIFTLFGLLAVAGCQSATKSNGATAPQQQSKVDFSPIIKAAKGLEAAQNAALTRGSGVRSAKDAAKLLNAYTEAIWNFCGSVDDFINFTPGLADVPDDSPDVKAFLKATEGFDLKPKPGAAKAWADVLAPYASDAEVIAARSGFLGAEERLKQWLDKMQRLAN